MPSDEIPNKIGDYHIIEEVGRGGMARVYKAEVRDAAFFVRTYALKLIDRDLSENTDFVDYFRSEARLGSLIQHPKVVTINRFGEDDRFLYLAMEFISGPTLTQLMQMVGEAFPVEAVLEIAAQILEGLAYVQELPDENGDPLNLVHRDLKPSNIFVCQTGEVKIGDFGMARSTANLVRTQVGMLKGTVRYMSPEQALGEEIDHRSDLFSLGCVLFELLAWRRLYELPRGRTITTQQLLRAVQDYQIRLRRGDFPDSAIGDALFDMLHRLLAFHPDDRFQSAAGALAMVEAIRKQHLPESSVKLDEWMESLQRAQPASQEASGRSEAPSVSSEVGGPPSSGSEKQAALENLSRESASDQSGPGRSRAPTPEAKAPGGEDAAGDLRASQAGPPPPAPGRNLALRSNATLLGFQEVPTVDDAAAPHRSSHALTFDADTLILMGSKPAKPRPNIIAEPLETPENVDNESLLAEGRSYGFQSPETPRAETTDDSFGREGEPAVPKTVEVRNKHATTDDSFGWAERTRTGNVWADAAMLDMQSEYDNPASTTLEELQLDDPAPPPPSLPSGGPPHAELHAPLADGELDLCADLVDEMRAEPDDGMTDSPGLPEGRASWPLLEPDASARAARGLPSEAEGPEDVSMSGCEPRDISEDQQDEVTDPHAYRGAALCTLDDETALDTLRADADSDDWPEEIQTWGSSGLETSYDCPDEDFRGTGNANEAGLETSPSHPGGGSSSPPGTEGAANTAPGQHAGASAALSRDSIGGNGHRDGGAPKGPSSGRGLREGAAPEEPPPRREGPAVAHLSINGTPPGPPHRPPPGPPHGPSHANSKRVSLMFYVAPFVMLGVGSFVAWWAWQPHSREVASRDTPLQGQEDPTTQPSRDQDAGSGEPTDKGQRLPTRSDNSNPPTGGGETEQLRKEIPPSAPETRPKTDHEPDRSTSSGGAHNSEVRRQKLGHRVTAGGGPNRDTSGHPPSLPAGNSPKVNKSTPSHVNVKPPVMTPKPVAPPDPEVGPAPKRPQVRVASLAAGWSLRLNGRPVVPNRPIDLPAGRRGTVEFQLVKGKQKITLPLEVRSDKSLSCDFDPDRGTAFCRYIDL